MAADRSPAPLPVVLWSIGNAIVAVSMWAAVLGAEFETIVALRLTACVALYATINTAALAWLMEDRDGR